MTKEDLELRQERKELLLENHNLTVKNFELNLENEELKKQFSLHAVSNTFKAQIKDELISLNEKLLKVKGDVKLSFEDPYNWGKRQNELKGEIVALTKALNFC